MLGANMTIKYFLLANIIYIHTCIIVYDLEQIYIFLANIVFRSNIPSSPQNSM